MSKNMYSPPIKRGDYSKIVTHSSPAYSKVVTGPLAHKEDPRLSNAIDFGCKEGTPIYAARNGEVVFLKIDSNKGGPDKKYWNEGNRLVIRHENGEYSAYEHLRYRGATVKVGDKVKEGEIIGYSGNTGYTFGPHLHFEVFHFTGPNKDEDYQTVKVNFKKDRSLEGRVTSVIAIGSLALSILLLTTNLTGHAVSSLNQTTINWISGIFFIIGLAGAFAYLLKKQKDIL